MTKRKVRLLCFFLSLCMVLGLAPMQIVYAATPGNVVYNRQAPESAVLNAYTGTSSSFYQALIKNYGKSGCDYTEYYNGISLFYGGDYSSVDFKTKIFDDKTGVDGGKLYFGGTESGYGNSVLRTLSKKSKNLSANLSATLYNRVHTHKASVFKVQDVLAYEKVRLYISGDYKSRLYGSSAGMDSKLPRLNNYDNLSDDPYTVIYYTDASHGKKAFIDFAKSSVEYAKGTCTCGGAYAEKMLVTFRDTSAPAISSVQYSTDGGKSWSRRSNLYIGSGSTLAIKITYDEPIRFADDSAAHDDLYITLNADGAAGTSPKAYLTELSDSSLYFEYTLTGSEGYMKINSISLASLFGDNLPLKQVVGDKSFTLTESDMGATLGFSDTTSYITDLAGNAITGKSHLTSLIFDTESPYIASVSFDGDTANSDVKEALGDELNKSDTHLGEGDSLRITAELNEEINFTKNGTRNGAYATLLTNIILTDGTVNNLLGDRAYGGLGTKTVDGKTFLTVSSAFLYASEGKTRITTGTIPIHSNMKTENVLGYENGDGLIYITAVEFLSEVNSSDFAGNPYSGEIAANANSGCYTLDVEEPEIASLGTTKEADGFRIGFQIEDNGSTASGINGIYGEFTLQNGGDGIFYEYEYVIDATPDMPQSGWQTSRFGEAVRFVQVASGNYLHVRPKDGVSYGDVSNCTADISVNDLAGNRTRESLSINENGFEWMLDGIAPTAYLKNISRSLSGNVGTLTAVVHLSDKGGLESASFSADDKQTFSPLSVTEGATEADTEAIIRTASGELFDKELIVSVRDLHGNETEISLGKITYDLSAAEYLLQYPTDYTDKATVTLTDLSADDELILLVSLPEKYMGKADRYAVFALTTDDQITEDEDLLSRTVSSNENGWYLMSAERTTESDGSIRYTFDADEEYRRVLDESTGYYKPNVISNYNNPASLRDFWSDMKAGRFSGNLSITVLSGKRGAFTRWADADGISGESGAPLAAGNDTYAISETSFTLHVSGNSDTLPYAPTLTVENAEELSVSYKYPYFSSNNDFQLSTLAGKQFTLSIPADEFGWNYEPLDYQNSYVLLTNRSTDPATEYKIPLAPFVTSSDNPDCAVQTVTVPSFDFGSGIYDVTLYVNSRVGNSYTEPLRSADGSIVSTIVVDVTEPNNDFYLSALTFEPTYNNLSVYDGLELFGYEKRDCTAENGVYTLPLYRTFSGSYRGNRSITFKTDNEKASIFKDGGYSYYVGQYALKIWNTDPELSVGVLELSSTSEDFSEVSYSDTEYFHGIEAVNSASEASRDDTLLLYPGKVNTVAVQKQYANGKTSDIKYYSFLPDNNFISGTAEVTTENGGKLIFTPDKDADTENAVLYANVYTAGKTEEDMGLYPQTPVTLELQADGTWQCALAENGANYAIVGINKNGSVALTDCFLNVNTPWFDESGVTVNDDGNGMYTVSFTLRDDRGDIRSNPPEITLSFDETYGALIDNGTFTFTPEFDDWGSYRWEAEAESPTGIYEITAVRGEGELYHNIDYMYDTLTVTVKAVCAADGASAAQPLTVTVSAKDRFGCTVQSSASGSIGSKKAGILDFSYTPGTLTARFNQPIRPMTSWAWQGDDKNAYFASEWNNAFPISGNGTHSIEYTDIFGNSYSESVTLTDTFIVNGTDYSIDLSFSTTDPTADGVIISASSHDGGQLIFWEREYDAGGTYRYTTVAPINGSANVSTESRSSKFLYNNEIRIVRYDQQYQGNYSGPWSGVSTYVYLTNIADAAPSATLWYYLESAGAEFTYDELCDYVSRFGTNGSLNSDGSVTVRYTTVRNVTPTDNTGIEHVFESGSNRSHTFRYVDDFGHEGSATASLPDGLILTDAPQQWVDIYAPIVTVNIYRKRFGAYIAAESFLADEDSSVVRDRFASVGAAQAFLLKLDIRDDSPYTISLSEADGATLSGNAITVVRPCDFTVTVTDSENNKTVFSVQSDMFGSIDTVSPTAQTEIVSSSMYEKDGYIRIYDVDENGNELVGSGHEVTLTQPTDVTRVTRSDGKEWYKLSFTENGTVGFVFHDEAGNYGNAYLTVNGIDTSAPVLALSWSPSYTYEQDGVMYYDDAYPTQNTVSGSITAHIESDVSLKEVRLESDGFAETTLPLDGSTVVLDSESGISARYGAERITVSYENNFEHSVLLTARGPNGRESSVTLSEIVDKIDRTAPVITETREPLTKSGSTVPFGYAVTLSPNEPAYSQNYGETNDGNPKYYDSTDPLVLSVTADGEFTVYFSDKAGNVTSHTVTVTGIDTVAPELTLRYPDDNPNLLRPTNDPVAIFVKADEDCTLTVGNLVYGLTKDTEKELSFAENGTFILKARDSAGNESESIITVHCIDTGIPSLRFDTNFVYLAEGSSTAELNALLDNGYTAWDNVEMTGYPVVHYDTSAVDLSAAGSYTVPYTVTDQAGNTFEAARFVNVVGKNTLCVYVNGKLILPEGTAVTEKGENTLTVHNLENVLPGEYEPHTIKIRKGILSLGQMKNCVGSSVKLDSDGKFTLDSSGFYTVLVTTQSKRTVRITLYVEP